MSSSANSQAEYRQPVPEPEEKYVAPLFAPSYYVAHLGIVLYILVGIGMQVYQYLDTQTYRVLSVATWPWVYTGWWGLLLLAVLLYGAALLLIAVHMRSKLDELNITWFTLLPYALFAFVWLAMFGRLAIYLISPEGIFIGE